MLMQKFMIILRSNFYFQENIIKKFNKLKLFLPISWRLLKREKSTAPWDLPRETEIISRLSLTIGFHTAFTPLDTDTTIYLSIYLFI